AAGLAAAFFAAGFLVEAIQHTP
ncbi:MAG: hypothetical protein RIT37_472, partial [Bacteroidota bacterium]